MKVNIKKLDDTIAKLQELRRLATDPAIAPFVITKGRTTANGASSSESTTNGHGALKANVLAACKTFTESFTIKDIFAQMQVMGYKPTSDSAEKSVGNMLRTLATDGKIKIAVQGKGRRATEYKNI